MSDTLYTQGEITSAAADVYRQGREHAATGGALLSQARLDRVRVMVAAQLNQDPAVRRLLPQQLEHLIDEYAAGYELGLDEYAQINDDTEGMEAAELDAKIRYRRN